MLPSTYSIASSILTTHTNLDDIRKIMVCDPSFLLNMLTAAGNVKKVFSVSEIISAVGVTNIQKIVQQSGVFPFSYAQEYKNTFDLFKFSEQVKKTTIIADMIAKDFNPDIRDKVAMLNGLFYWHKFYALCFNPDLVIKKDFLTAKDFFKDFLKDSIRNPDLINAFTDNKNIVRGICKIAEDIYETKNPNDHLFKIFPQQDKTELEAKILKVLEDGQNEFLTVGEFIEYAISLEEHIEEFHAKKSIAKWDKEHSEQRLVAMPDINTPNIVGVGDVLRGLSDGLFGEKVKSDMESLVGVFFHLGINAFFVDESLPGRVIFKNVLMAEKCEITKDDNPDYVTRMLKTLKSGKRYKNKDLFFLKNINIFSAVVDSEEHDLYVLNSSYFGIKVLFSKEEPFSEDEIKVLDFSLKLIDTVLNLKKMETERQFSGSGHKLPELRAGSRLNLLKLALDDYKLNLKNYSNIDNFKFGDVHIIFDLLNKKYENVMKEFYNTVVSLNNN